MRIRDWSSDVCSSDLPSGSSSLPADTVTCAAMGCHALSTLTAILVRDTAGTEEIQPISPELIDDQARCLLEDMTVHAIKVGPLYTTESVSVLAQIAADSSEEHTSELQSLMRISYAVLRLQKK